MQNRKDLTKEIGRNDPCPCGSGKKYKKCCLHKASSNITTVDFAWHTLRQTEGRVIDNHLIPYVTKKLPQEFMKDAIEDFMLEDFPEEMDRELLFYNFFIPWFLFDWVPFDDFGEAKFDSEKTISENYLELCNNKLSHAEKCFINAMNHTYYSFYSVLEVVFEQSLFIKDILLGTTHTIKEKQGTHKLKRGDIVFSRFLSLDDQSIFVGMAPYIIPVRYYSTLLDFRDWLIEENDHLDLDPIVLRHQLDIEVFDYFFEITEQAYNTPVPTLINTDGELILFSKSVYQLKIPPEEALTRLLSLTLLKKPDKVLSCADRDESGSVIRIEFPWLKKGNKKHQSWENTVMGQIVIENNKLTLETNSEKRTQKGKKLLTQYLDEDICFKHTLIETPEQKLKSLPESSLDDKDGLDVFESPEMQKKIEQMAKEHWDNWFDEPIPALHHQTPREAAKTKKGREHLEGLLLQFERYSNNQKENNLYEPDISYLKSELGLE